MERIMVVFSSTDIPEELIQKSLNLAERKRAELVILDVRDREMSEKVGDLAENIGFMGDKVVRGLKRKISHERCDVIFKKLSILEEKAKERGIPYEILVVRGPFVKSILRIAKKKKVKTIICQSREVLPRTRHRYEVIQV